MKSLIVLHSYHHGNTRKIANAIAEGLNAEQIEAVNASGTDLDDYNLVGFGAGIDSGHHYTELLDYVKGLPQCTNKPCFIFSTSAIYSEKKMKKDHRALREILQEKGFVVRGEFSCKGFNTNLFLKYMGGMNKGYPTPEDLDNASRFMQTIMNA